MKKIAISIALAIGIGISATACGAGYDAAHNHNSPTPSYNDHSFHTWHWFESPGNFQTIIYTCVGTEGYYETQDNSYPIVIVPQDPICGYNGAVSLRTAR